MEAMPGIIDGRDWLANRRRFLQEQLAKDPTAEQRAAIEAELADLDQELTTSRRHRRRWSFWGARPPI